MQDQNTEPVIHNSGSYARIAGRDYYEHYHEGSDVHIELRVVCDHPDRDGCLELVRTACGQLGYSMREVCSHDAAQVRRQREAARKQAVEQRVIDVVRMICYAATLIAVVRAMQWSGEWQMESVAMLCISVPLLTCMLGEILTYTVVMTELRLEHAVSSWLCKHGLGWLLPGNRGDIA